MTSERKIRFWVASVAFGVASSILLQGIGYWFPPFWPGLLVALAVTTLIGHSLSVVSGLGMMLAGNMLFYTWIFSRIIRAEISARGHLSRYFLQ